MSVLIVTSLGDIVVDLHADKCPLTSKNFLKLCKIKYYNGCLFHTVQKDFTAQTGDPTGTGSGGDSVYKFLYGDQARFFGDEIRLDLKHTKTGTVSMASAGENLNASQFYITLRDDLDYLDGKHTVFGEVAEGHDTLTRINEAYVDEKGRPYKNIRIKHTYILEDPYDDPPQLAEMIPDASPEGKPKDEVDDDVRLEDDWVPLDENLAPAELEELLRSKQAHSSAVVLETIGDIPDAEIKPPDDVLFVCKLNPVTEDEDLHTIFSRFGTVLSAEVIRDFKTGDSLCYAFIEFESKEACEQAYFKMDNALIDDRRIHVDFSQSVAKLWSQYRRKDYGKGKGSGCFKCGSVDHIAKDCTGGPASKQPQKYVLKEDNTQHGGANSSYEMVFDGDTQESPTQEHKHRGHCPNDQDERRKINGEEQRSRDPKKRESHGRQSERDKSRGYKEDGLRRENKETQPHGNRDDRHYEEWNSEKHRDRHRDPGGDKVGDRGYRKSSEHGRHGGSRDGWHLEDNSREKDRDRRRDRDNGKADEREYQKRSSEHGRHTERRNDEDYRKAADRETYTDGSEGRDNRKRSTDADERAEKRRQRDDRRR